MGSRKETEKSQSEKFIDKARELGADESEKAFDRKLRKIAKRDKISKDQKPKERSGG